jgi:Ca2+-binding EF-hand superfamily protein
LCLKIDPDERISSTEALSHLWLAKVKWLSKLPLTDAFESIERSSSVRVFKTQLLSFLVQESETEEFKENLKQVFEQFDLNKDGFISLQELKQGYNSYFMKSFNDDEIEKVFFDADADNSG